MPNSKLISFISLITLVFAIGLSIYLSIHHYQLQYSMRSEKSFCNQSSGFDCDSVNISSFSELAGVPVALIGVFAFLVQFLFLIGIVVLGEDEKSKPRRVFFVLSVANIIFCLYLAAVSWLSLKTFCLYCFMLYVLCAILLFCSYKLKDENTLKFKKFFSEDLKSMAVIALLAVIPVGSLLVNASVKDSFSKDLDRIIDSAVIQWMENKSFEFNLENAPFIGSTNPKLTLVVFSDFQCPHCKKSAPTLEAFTNANRKKVRLVFQNYPLDSACNPKMQSQGHSQSCFFAKAVICANKQNKYVEAHNWIFKHQESLNKNLLDTMISEVKLDKNQITTCMEQSSTSEELTNQIKRADLAEIQGTPTIFANGRLLPYGFLIPVLEKALKTTAN
ncbi:MAG: thioredoxin domain-containing protein [Oligoflexia bacterium]|nr:thioredoxin domain-containing protein [Oligoflexia bacterium]